MKPSVFNILIDNAEDSAVILNARTGFLIKTPQKAYRQLCSAAWMDDAESSPYIQAFARRKFCVADDADEFGEYISQIESYRQHLFCEEISFTIAVTTDCNYRCSYCFEKGVLGITMDLATQQKLVDYIMEAARHNPLCKRINIVWFGGEPLLAFEAIQYISRRLWEYCRQNHLAYSSRIISNGALLTEEIAKELNAYNLKSFHITLDGTRDVYCRLKQADGDDFEKVMGAIASCCTRMPINIRLNCCKENFSSLLELVGWLCRKDEIKDHIHLYLAPIRASVPGVTAYSEEEFADAYGIFLQYLYNLSWFEQIRNAIFIPKLSPCNNLCPYSFTVDSRGNFFQCESLLGNACRQLGNLDTPAEQVLEMKRRLWDSYYDSLPEKCCSCAYFPLCHSGCPSERRYPGDGSCIGLKRQIKDTFRYIGKIEGDCRGKHVDGQI